MVADAATRKRVHRGLAAEKEKGERVDGIGDVSGAVTVGVERSQTARPRATEKEVAETEDGIGDVHLAIRVRVLWGLVVGQVLACVALATWPDAVRWIANIAAAVSFLCIGVALRYARPRARD